MNNRRLIQLFLLVLAIFVVFRAVPMVNEWRGSLQTDIERLEDRRDQLERLLEKRGEWQERHEQLSINELDIGARALPGGRPEVASARLQSLLRTNAAEAGVEISSLSLPEFEEIGSWRLLQEVVTMRGSEVAMLEFLERLESGKTLLRVVGSRMRKEQDTLFGSATVVGFSPLVTERKEEAGE